MAGLACRTVLGLLLSLFAATPGGAMRSALPHEPKGALRLGHRREQQAVAASHTESARLSAGGDDQHRFLAPAALLDSARQEIRAARRRANTAASGPATKSSEQGSELSSSEPGSSDLGSSETGSRELDSSEPSSSELGSSEQDSSDEDRPGSASVPAAGVGAGWEAIANADSVPYDSTELQAELEEFTVFDRACRDTAGLVVLDSWLQARNGTKERYYGMQVISEKWMAILVSSITGGVGHVSRVQWRRHFWDPLGEPIFDTLDTDGNELLSVREMHTRWHLLPALFEDRDGFKNLTYKMKSKLQISLFEVVLFRALAEAGHEENYIDSARQTLGVTFRELRLMKRARSALVDVDGRGDRRTVTQNKCVFGELFGAEGLQPPEFHQFLSHDAGAYLTAEGAHLNRFGRMVHAGQPLANLFIPAATGLFLLLLGFVHLMC